ncbi:hypothetical protein [Marinomonas fungiae]|uniref:hypothetical protein n=1 Tax=Marinomonas fungiae TaxID=1137284 RepID=UPI003A8FB8A0
MSKLRGEKLYRAALERLKTGETEVVDTTSPNFRFSTTIVAEEAGKKKGFIRSERYPQLCKEIEEQEIIRQSQLAENPKKVKKTSDARIEELSNQYESLKREHEACLERMLNLIKTNYELQSENKHLKALTNNVSSLNPRQ